MARSSERLAVIPTELRRDGEGVVPSHKNAGSGLLVAFGFHCNVACSFCMVEDLLNENTGATLETFRRFLANPEAMKGIDRIVLSGGEATLEKDLFDYVAAARSHPAIEHVRIQTNATRLGLSGGKLLNRLLDAGVDEFFVSLHGHDEATVDGITRKKGSFGRIINGLEAIAASSASLLTNTVLVQQNHENLDAIVELAAPYGPTAMEFWNLWPRIDPDDEREHIVPVAELHPNLVKAFTACDKRDIPSLVKWFPRCLLGPFADRLDNSQPTALIEEDYWETTPPYGCLWEGLCTHAPRACSGLSHAYIRKYGWEEELLKFDPGHTENRGLPNPSPAPDPVAYGTSPRTLSPPQLLARLRLPPGQTFAGWILSDTEANSGTLSLVFRRADATEPLVVELSKNSALQPCYAQTPSFNIAYLQMDEGRAPLIGQAMQELVRHLSATDTGGLALQG